MSVRAATAFAPPRDPSEFAVADWTTAGGTRQRVQADAHDMMVPAEFAPRPDVKPSESANPAPIAETRPPLGAAVISYQAPSASQAGSLVGGHVLPTPKDLNKLEVLGHLPAVPYGARSSRRGFGAFFRPARLLPETERFVVAQKWEGIVTAVNGDMLIARLNDLSHGGGPEEVELPLEELSEDDLPLVEPGAVFYWSIGYLVTTGGQRTRQSSIRFRRLPAWSPGELDAARARARKLKDELGW